MVTARRAGVDKTWPSFGWAAPLRGRASGEPRLALPTFRARARFTHLRETMMKNNHVPLLFGTVFIASFAVVHCGSNTSDTSTPGGTAGSDNSGTSGSNVAGSNDNGNAGSDNGNAGSDNNSAGSNNGNAGSNNGNAGS